MLIFATFEQSTFVELALVALEQGGIRREKILAVPLDKRTEPRKLFDTIHSADGFSLFDLPAILGTCGMLLGAIYGYVLRWGPILWGIIGLVAGLISGYVIKIAMVQKNNTLQKQVVTEVILVIRCAEHQEPFVSKTLWDNTALGVSTVHNSKESN